MSPGVIRFRGYAIEDLIGSVTFAQMIWLMTRGELPDPRAAKLLEAALVAAVDHGPQAPSIAIARMAMTCGVGINNAMASATNVLGDVHGGAGEQCMALFEAIAARRWRKRRAAPILQSPWRRKSTAQRAAGVTHLPGFGHRFHPVDPRAPRLLALVDEAKAQGVVSGRYCAIARAHGRRHRGAARRAARADEHRRRDGGDLRRARVCAHAVPRPLHSLALGGRARARVGGEPVGRAQQGPDSARSHPRLWRPGAAQAAARTTRRERSRRARAGAPRPRRRPSRPHTCGACRTGSPCG